MTVEDQNIANASFPSIAAMEHEVGKEIFVSDWIVVEQQAVDLFAKATGDFQWIHVDIDRAKRESPFGGPIAHGFLILSLVAKFVGDSVKVEGVRSAVNYGLNKVRFVSPVRVGTRIRGRGTLSGYEPIAGGAQIFWQLTVEVDGQDKPACVAETIGRYFG